MPRNDEFWMSRAIELARRGIGRVEPNPPVGAVIVRGGVMVAEAWHERFGGAHAEALAIATAGDCRGATLYVTLAPCTGTRKKTPPCCDAVLAAGFARVVIGCADPTQESTIPRLEKAGVETVCGVLEQQCRRLIAPFLKLKTQGLPWVILKWAMTADGRIATAGGESKWISGEPARNLVHEWRNQADAILVGAGTVRKDDPLLTCRLPGGRNPRRVVVDARAEIPLNSRLVTTVSEAPLIVACTKSAPEAKRQALADAGATLLLCDELDGRVDLADLLTKLGQLELTNLLVEGGAEILGSFIDQRLADEARISIAPKLFGGRDAISPVAGAGISSIAEALTLHNAQWTQVGEDMLLTGEIAECRPATRTAGKPQSAEV